MLKKRSQRLALILIVVLLCASFSTVVALAEQGDYPALSMEELNDRWWGIYIRAIDMLLMEVDLGASNRSDKLAEALEIANQAVWEFEPTSTDYPNFSAFAYNMRSKVYQAWDKNEEVIADCRKTIALFADAIVKFSTDNDGGAWYSLLSARAFERIGDVTGDYTEALEYIHGLDLDKMSGSYVDALKELQTVLEEAP